MIPDDNGVLVRSADKLVFSSDFFTLFRLKTTGEVWKCPEDTNWLQWTVLEGQGTINGIKFSAGESAIAFDGVVPLEIQGSMEVLISWQKK
jgi:hypothetical protein